MGEIETPETPVPSSDTADSSFVSSATNNSNNNGVVLQQHSQSPPPAPPSTPLFFADAVLDLNEAHDIAETPEVPLRSVVPKNIVDRSRGAMSVPPLELTSDDDHHRSSTNGATNDPSIDLPYLTNDTATTTANTTATKATSSASNNPKTRFTRIQHSTIAASTRPKSPPRWPRDIPWAVAFVLIVPTTLIGSIVTQQSKSIRSMHQYPLAQAPLATASFASCILATITALILSRLLYSQNSEGRHKVAHTLTTLSPVAHVAITTLLAILLLGLLRGLPRLSAIVPLYFVARDVVLSQRSPSSWSSSSSTSNEYDASRHRQRLGWMLAHPSSTSSSSTRHAFFQALVETALDILSRSLRRPTFGRVLIGILIVQSALILIWRQALLVTLGQWHWFVAVVLAGKWATGTCARLLTLLAAGGVAGWFLDQAELLQHLHPSSAAAGAVVSNLGSGDDDYNGGIDDRNSMPEAYRTVDASVYQSVLDLDDDDEDDDLLEEDDDMNDMRTDNNQYGMEAPTTIRSNGRSARGPSSTTNAGAANSSTHHHPRTTVKSILWSGLTTSFGSVAQCGLLGGLAQFVWSQVRKVDVAHDLIRKRRQQHRQRQGGFNTMTIGSSAEERSSNICNRIGMCGLNLARGFVRQYSDLAMSHVASYFKSYQRAARDVATLVEESGVELILDDDVTTHMCACTGGVLSGMIVILTSTATLRDGIDDWQVVANVFLSFYLSYTILFTVLEPLRSSIKAFYVMFAQHPQSLSQAFPLIYHRLCRLADDNASLSLAPTSTTNSVQHIQIV